MKKELCVCFFIIILCLFYMSIPDVVFGQVLAKQMFSEYKELLLREDIYPGIQQVLHIYKNSEHQQNLKKGHLDVFLASPATLTNYDPNLSTQFIGLLSVDNELRKLFRDVRFFNILKDSDEIDELLRLIDDALTQPTKLEIVSGNNQIREINTPLPEPLIVVVKDKKGDPIEGISVNFSVSSGAGEFSDEKLTTDSNGQASTTFTLGPTPGTTSIEARVDGIAEPVTFTATATTTSVEVPTEEPKPAELVVSLSPSEIASPEIGEDIVLTVRIKRGESITGYEITVEYDPTAIEYVELDDPKFNCDYLPDAYQLKEDVDKVGKVTLAAVSPFVEINGNGILAKLTFRVKEKKASTVTLAKVNLSDSNGNLLSPIPKTPIPENIKVQIMDLDVDVNDENLEAVDIEDFNGDGKVNFLDLVLVAQLVDSAATKVSCVIPDDVDVNGDGIVNILDLVLVASKVGFLDDVDVNRDGIANILDLILVANKIGETDDIDDVDVNKDGKVNVLDLILVVGKIGESPTAPSLYSLEQFDLSATDIQELITQIKAFQINGIDNSVVDPAYQRGIAILEDLLESLMQAQKEVPQKTALFVNYPNPFNPETWIPYQLGEATDVTVTIHAMNGSLVRRLSLGHQVAGVYRSKSRAAYWDGRNVLGEPVASGLYFYTFQAGTFSATGKMLIRK